MLGDILTNKCATDKLFIIGYDETAGVYWKLMPADSGF